MNKQKPHRLRQQYGGYQRKVEELVQSMFGHIYGDGRRFDRVMGTQRGYRSYAIEIYAGYLNVINVTPTNLILKNKRLTNAMAVVVGAFLIFLSLLKNILIIFMHNETQDLRCDATQLIKAGRFKATSYWIVPHAFQYFISVSKIMRNWINNYIKTIVFTNLNFGP